MLKKATQGDAQLSKAMIDRIDRLSKYVTLIRRYQSLTLRRPQDVGQISGGGTEDRVPKLCDAAYPP